MELGESWGVFEDHFVLTLVQMVKMDENDRVSVLGLHDQLHRALAPNIVPVSDVDSIANCDFLESFALLPGGLEVLLPLQCFLDFHIFIALHRLCD